MVKGGKTQRKDKKERRFWGGVGRKERRRKRRNGKGRADKEGIKGKDEEGYTRRNDALQFPAQHFPPPALVLTWNRTVLVPALAGKTPL